MKELEAAQRQLSRQLEEKKNSLSRSGRKAKDFYAPMNLIGNAVNSVLPLSEIGGFLLGLVRGAKKQIKEK